MPLGVAFPPSGNDEQRAFTADALRTLCAKGVRFAQPWSTREPERGAYRWRPLDRRLSAFAAEGQDVMLTLELRGWPAWYTALTEKERRSSFRSYVRALLDRGPVASIQFGNEWTWELERFFPGDVADYIDLTNILYDEVQRRSGPHRPRVVLGSLSIGGLHALALARGRLDGVVFEGGALYSEADIAAARRQSEAYLARVTRIFRESRYDDVDIHLHPRPQPARVQAFLDMIQKQDQEISKLRAELAR
ncbi:MAG: hypothetical protein AAGN82_12580, partial [Myxococcota bacterium]